MAELYGVSHHTYPYRGTMDDSDYLAACADTMRGSSVGKYEAAVMPQLSFAGYPYYTPHALLPTNTIGSPTSVLIAENSIYPTAHVDIDSLHHAAGARTISSCSCSSGSPKLNTSVVDDPYTSPLLGDYICKPSPQYEQQLIGNYSPPYHHGYSSNQVPGITMHDVQSNIQDFADDVDFPAGPLPSNRVAFPPNNHPPSLSGHFSDENLHFDPDVQDLDEQPIHSQCEREPHAAPFNALSPVIRRRRAQGQKRAMKPSKSSKDPASIQRTLPPTQHAHGSTQGHAHCNATDATFPCPFAVYGCTSTFGSKNEWKRHVSSQHMRLEFWRCDQCTQVPNRKPNDFNRKDLFTQHVRRMHLSQPSKTSGSPSGNSIGRRRSTPQATTRKKDAHEDRALAAAAKRCYRRIRSPPELSSCLFCEETFSGGNSWEERMEHIGKHMEVLKKHGTAIPSIDQWNHDQAVHEWMLDNGDILEVNGGEGFCLAHEVA